MDENATDSDGSPGAVYTALPLWYKILVCAGSAGVGGFFGVIYGITGIIFAAVGGLGVAVFWLKRVSRFQTQSVAAAIFGGIGWGIVAGLIDTVWLHATGLTIMFTQVGRPRSFVGFEIVLVIAILCGVIAGAVYGLVCMVVLEIYRANTRRGQG
ncbi:MAG: hypothetical protein QGH60_06230 [Phycisphaerae bacterium]|jgi:hypothetical protein|nr:hypothetical protein [Phycisphaerae bacterium]